MKIQKAMTVIVATMIIIKTLVLTEVMIEVILYSLKFF